MRRRQHRAQRRRDERLRVKGIGARDVRVAQYAEIDFALLNEQQRVEVARYERRLKDDQYDDIRPKLLCSFFGERSLAAIAKRGNTEGAVVVDAEGILWLPATQGNRSLGVRPVSWAGWRFQGSIRFASR